MHKRRLSPPPGAPDAHNEQDMKEEEQGITAPASSSSPSPSASSATRLPLSATDRTERRRKQCRISQRRYRDKKGSAEYNLRLDINSLRESVERLKQARGLLHHKIQHDRNVLKQSVLKAVEQYYAIFQYGLHDPLAGDHVRKCYDIQISFLKAFMASHVQSGSGIGVGAVIEQWRRYSRFHSSVQVELLESHVFGSDSESPIVKATGTLTVTLNQSTLDHIFPHVMATEENSLGSLLLGQRVQYTTCTEYVFDEKVQVIRQDFTIDFLSGLGVVLKDPFLTAKVLKGAKISDASCLGMASDQEEEDEDEDEGGDEDEDEEDKARSSMSGSASTSTSSSERLGLPFIMS